MTRILIIIAVLFASPVGASDYLVQKGAECADFLAAVDAGGGQKTEMENVAIFYFRGVHAAVTHRFEDEGRPPIPILSLEQQRYGLLAYCRKEPLHNLLAASYNLINQTIENQPAK